MRLGKFTLIFLAASVFGRGPAAKLWGDLKSKRDQLPSYQQEFEVSRTTRTARNTQALERRVILDVAQQRWREKTVSGSGNRIRIFDGQDLFALDEGSEEIVRIKRRQNDSDPLPSPYLPEADWAKATELQRQPCGLSGVDHVCVAIEVPLTSTMQTVSAGGATRTRRGLAQVSVDTETGLVLTVHVIENVKNERSQYVIETNYVMKRLKLSAPPDAALFRPPDGMHEVKQLSRWNAARIKKDLAGKPAPALSVTDIDGNAVSLSAFKGKAVLLDFWTTWCPPCRADAPALDKLYRKYGQKELTIIGISVNEEHSIVERFLKEHPHAFPTVLTTENEMPPAYQIGIFPTYIVVSPDGTIASAVEGDRGFGDLRNLLKKAGLEVD